MSESNNVPSQESGEASSSENAMLDIIRSMDAISEERTDGTNTLSQSETKVPGQEDPSMEDLGDSSDCSEEEQVSLPRDLVRRASSSLLAMEPQTPKTPAGWVALLSVLGSALTLKEIRLQKSLTGPPLVYAQSSPKMDQLQEILSKNTSQTCGRGMLTRDVKPSLFVGTRSHLASAAAYALHGPKERHLRFEEKMHMTSDGAEISVVWEVPRQTYKSSLQSRLTNDELKEQILNGPIDRPVVIILHGINNSAHFGYMKDLMRSCSDKGWIACGVNFRGCGGVKMTTPRGYNAAYTGDLRTIIQKVEARLEEDTPIFLMGNSLGANIMTKYLGEEGYCKTLPKCIAGAVSLGNPLHIKSSNLKSPWAELLGLGIKKTVVENWRAIGQMSCFHFQSAVRKALLSRTLGQLDDSMAPFLVRNEPYSPFQQKIGYENGDAYWKDASSNRYVQHISGMLEIWCYEVHLFPILDLTIVDLICFIVPLLNLTSKDDFLVNKHAMNSLEKCTVNPNVIVVKTKCGGHLGWQESPPDGKFGLGKSWATTAAAEFISAVLEMRSFEAPKNTSPGSEAVIDERKLMLNAQSLVEDMYSLKKLTSKL